MERDTTEAERERQAHRQAQHAFHAAKRSTTATFSHEETDKRRNQRKKAVIEGRVATAPKEKEDKAKHRCIARLYGPEAAEVMRTKPTRLPDLVLEGPHEAAPALHEDWTIVPGSNTDPDKWELEPRLRDSRNRLIREHLDSGCSVFYKSSGNSMWPLVRADDACTFHPIQAVTAKDGVHSIQKEASEIGVGDIVFCQVQRSQQYYAHIVLEIQDCYYRQEPKYWIGNIQGRVNGWCYREHIFGILVEVQQVWEDGQYYSRPHPKTNFAEVRALVKGDKWNSRAKQLCEPVWHFQSSGAQSSGQQGCNSWLQQLE